MIFPGSISSGNYLVMRHLFDNGRSKKVNMKSKKKHKTIREQMREELKDELKYIHSGRVSSSDVKPLGEKAHTNYCEGCSFKCQATGCECLCHSQENGEKYLGGRTSVPDSRTGSPDALTDGEIFSRLCMDDNCVGWREGVMAAITLARNSEQQRFKTFKDRSELWNEGVLDERKRILEIIENLEWELGDVVTRRDRDVISHRELIKKISGDEA